MEQQKRIAAEAAINYIQFGDVVGVGTGSTVRYFIESLANVKSKIDGAVASSIATENLLKKHGIPVLDLNRTGKLPLYIDGADEATLNKHLIKGGGGALTREKIIAAASEKFYCIVDRSKIVDVLGEFPLPVEVIPIAQSFVSREIIVMGGLPELRANVTTDNGNVIVDVRSLDLVNAVQVEDRLNSIAGVVANGIFARRPADVLLIGDDIEVQVV